MNLVFISELYKHLTPNTLLPVSIIGLTTKAIQQLERIKKEQRGGNLICLVLPLYETMQISPHSAEIQWLWPACNEKVANLAARCACRATAFQLYQFIDLYISACAK